ncbi:hypothetical protein [Flavobacterium sp.]|uniref:hypothetical protein n=1 Tax=Flavobacterium sp. TaxID=239 RepID=UPI001ACEB1D9|nr:hypothetical protein [Flavobacterium sp.]MBN9284262.1 hypothetical protein [Flavobacterium sp.]
MDHDIDFGRSHDHNHNADFGHDFARSADFGWDADFVHYADFVRYANFGYDLGLVADSDSDPDPGFDSGFDSGSELGSGSEFARDFGFGFGFGFVQDFGFAGCSDLVHRSDFAHNLDVVLQADPGFGRYADFCCIVGCNAHLSFDFVADLDADPILFLLFHQVLS